MTPAIYQYCFSLRRVLLGLLLGAVVTSCAVYRPAPLNSSDVEIVLASPDRNVLERQAAQLSRPTHPAIAPLTLDFSRPLTTDEIVVVAVLANPDLRALRAQQQVADAQVFAAGLVPDPQISFGLDKVLSPVDPALSTAFAGSLSLDLLGPLITRRVAREAAQSAARKVRLDIAWQEWLIAGQARLLALRIELQREAAQLARHASDVAEHALQRALTLAASGDVKQDEIELRRIAATENFSRALAAERDYNATRLELNRVLGFRPAELVQLAVPEPLKPWTAPDAEQLFAESRTHRLDLLALAAGYDSQESAVHRAILGQYPRLSITLNRARDTSHVQTMGPAVSFDLPLWNRNRGAIATAAADRNRLRAEYAARLHQTRADIAALVSALTRDEQSRAALTTELPHIQQIAASFETAAARGDVTLAVAEAARAAAVDKQLASIALEQVCTEQRLALSLAVGRPLVEFTNP